MRHVATTALFLGLIQSNANAELAAPPKVAADDVNSAAAATLVREADTPARDRAESARRWSKSKRSPRGRIRSGRNSWLGEGFRFHVPDAAVGGRAERSARSVPHAADLAGEPVRRPCK